MAQSATATRKRVLSDLKSILPESTYNVSIRLASRILGMSFGHARTLVAQNIFPVAIVREGGRNYVTITALADYLVLKIKEGVK